jgi:hypothetical protein
MGNSNDKAHRMTVTDLKWHTRDDGLTWMLYGDYKGEAGFCINRKMFDLRYLGLTRAANWKDRKKRWKAQDFRYWVDNQQDIPEFLDLDEAKAWVLTIITLEN